MNARLLAVKAVAGTSDLIEGLGMPFGGPFNGKDVEGEFFSARTDFAFDWFGERPLIYHHGLEAPGTSVVGRVKSFEVKEGLGVWVRCQLDRGSRYFSAIKEMLNRQALYFSSGSVSHLAQVAKSGEILRWPWVELSLTPTPANPFAKLDLVTAKSHFAKAGLAWPEAPQSKTVHFRLARQVPTLTGFYGDIAVGAACRALHLTFEPRLCWVESTSEASEAVRSFPAPASGKAVYAWTPNRTGGEARIIFVRSDLGEGPAVEAIAHECRHRWHRAWDAPPPEDEEGDCRDWAASFCRDFFRDRA